MRSGNYNQNAFAPRAHELPAEYPMTESIANSPAEYPRRVLLAVTGLSPQVVTETLFALTQTAEERFVPTEVHLVTTADGAERARLSLLSEDPGWFERFCTDYSLPSIDFGIDNIHMLIDGQGHALSDIRSREENERAADLITEQVRAFTKDSRSALHVSIAGGRKTLGYYLGYALSLFGRPQDRLSHVLVAEPFESSWDFFYPTPYSRVIAARDNSLVDTAEARVTLADIPFVSLRGGLPERLLKGRASFGQTVAAARKALEPPELVIDRAGRRIRAGGEVIEMTPADLAFYSMMARRRADGERAARRGDRKLAEAYLLELELIVGEMSGELERAESALEKGMSEKYFDPRKSATNAALESALGSQLARGYLIQSSGRGSGRYGLLGIEPDAIRYERIAT